VKTERGIFLVPWTGIDIRRTAELLGESSADFISISVKDSMGRTWARSDVVPEWAGGRDPLKDACDVFHRAGLKIRASIAVFADAYHGQLHPDWVAKGADGGLAARPGWSEDWYYHLCPTREPHREYTLRFVEELTSRYEFDGIDLDFIRFPWKAANQDGPERRFCFCDHCRTEFKKVAGEDVLALESPELEPEWYRWRADLISSMVESVGKITVARHMALAPFIALWSADGFGLDELNRSSQRFGQDHRRLAKICDQLSPMVYHRFTDEPTCYTLRSVRWVRDVTWHLRELGATVCSVVQGGPPASPLEVIDAVRAAVDAGAAAIMSYPGLSWTVDNAYWVALGRAYQDIAVAETG